jgi:hypothetical protein
MLYLALFGRFLHLMKKKASENLIVVDNFNDENSEIKLVKIQKQVDMKEN